MRPAGDPTRRLGSPPCSAPSLCSLRAETRRIHAHLFPGPLGLADREGSLGREALRQGSNPWMGCSARMEGSTAEEAGRDVPSEDVGLLFDDLGFSLPETRAYFFLLRSGPATPTAIARGTGQSRGKIYETMRRLAERGFVREEPTRPIRYAPAPLAETVSLAAARLSRQSNALRELRSLHQRLVASASSPEPRLLRPGDVRVFSGRAACLAELRRVVAHSRALLIAGGGRFAARLRHSGPLLQDLRDAVARGADVQILVPLSPEREADRRALNTFFGPRVVVAAPHLADLPLVTVASPSVAMDILAQPDDERSNRGDDVAVRVENPLYARAIRSRLVPPAAPGPAP